MLRHLLCLILSFMKRTKQHELRCREPSVQTVQGGVVQFLFGSPREAIGLQIAQ